MKIYFLLAGYLLVTLGCGSEHQPMRNQPADSNLVLFNGIYYEINNNKDSLPFMDFPNAFRNFFLPNCSGCHSNRLEYTDERGSLNLNTWSEVVAYGPLKLVMIAQTGEMPIRPLGKVPEPTLNDAINFLIEGVDGSFRPGSFPDIINSKLREITERYCGRCHGSQGLFLQEVDLRTYADWQENAALNLQSVSGASNVVQMPTAGSPELKLWNNSPKDRAALISWLQNGLPNGE